MPLNKSRTHLILGFTISIAALIWFFLGISWSELKTVLKEIDLLWVGLAAALLLGEFALRALRWKILLRPLGLPVELKDLFTATVIGAAANTLLPLRAGEIAKPLIASRRTGHSIPSVIATSIMERVYDLFGLLCVLVGMVLFLAPNLDQTATSTDQLTLIQNLKLYGGLFGAFSLGCMVIFFTLASQKQRSRHIFERILSIAPTPVQKPFLHLFDGFVAGLENSRDLHGLWQAGLLSILLWYNGAAAIYCLFHAFGFLLPFGAACFVSVAIALTVALPQAPGFMGVFHVAMEKTMLLWGENRPSKDQGHNTQGQLLCNPQVSNK
jgi:uncharacterized protein (TIRG00374 family)